MTKLELMLFREGASDTYAEAIENELRKLDYLAYDWCEKPGFWDEMIANHPEDYTLYLGEGGLMLRHRIVDFKMEVDIDSDGMISDWHFYYKGERVR